MPLAQISRLISEIKIQPSLKQKLLVRLMLWKNQLPPHSVMPPDEDRFYTDTDSWIGYLMAYYHYIKLILLLPGFLHSSSQNLIDDPIIEKCLVSCKHLTRLARAYKIHSNFELMPLFLSNCLFIGGVFNCAFSNLTKMSHLLETLPDYLSALQQFSQVYPVNANQYYTLIHSFQQTPEKSVEYLYMLQNRIYYKED
jgi:hypothetical protein